MQARGAGVIEYIVVLGLIALAALAGFFKFSHAVRQTTLCLAAQLGLGGGGDGCGDSKGVDASANVKDAAIALQESGGMVCNNMGCAGAGGGAPGNCFAGST